MMDGEGLIDLDELVLRCRDKTARGHIAEAVACYKAGAFRQSIVATWIAVVYDILHKLRELELTGDKNAISKLRALEQLRANNDINRSLAFERQILEMARDEFELISSLERIDLARLQDDRNRCAHPLMQSEDQTYRPSPELARTHIRNAVEYLLAHPPVQGKAALDRLIAEVQSEYFPPTPAAAQGFFGSGPLSRPRESLVRGFVTVLSKTMLLGDLDEKARRRYAAALNAVRSMHRESSEGTLRGNLNGIMKRVSDDRLLDCLKFIHMIPDTWHLLQADMLTRISTYVRGMSDDDLFPGLLIALENEPWKQDARTRIGSVTDSQLATLIQEDDGTCGPELVDRAVQLYEESGSFNSANYRGTRLVIPLARNLQLRDIERIARAATKNDQIAGSFERRAVVKAILDAGCFPRSELEELLSARGLVELDTPF